MAIRRVHGPPDLSVTFTCNSKWREIADDLSFEAGQRPCDCVDLIVRLLAMEVGEFRADIMNGKKFGHVLAVEFRKRGQPHIHCLVWLASSTSDFSSSTAGDEDDGGYEDDTSKPSPSKDA